MEWGVLASVVAVISPVLIVIVTYVKTWSKFEITVSNLSSVVERLSELLDTLQKNHTELSETVIRLEARVSNIEKQID